MERVKQFLKSEVPCKWLFYGDSITHGVLHTFGWRDYAELFEERVRFELRRTMDIVINTAISGNTTRALLTGFDWRVAQFKPDVVFIMIGMNDCSKNNDITVEEFERNLLDLTAKTVALGALPVLQTTCPILPQQAPDRAPNFDSYMEKIRKVANECQFPIIDHTQYWQQNPNSHFYWMSNAFHPNNYGHRAFADYIYRCLEIHDVASLSCRLDIP